ncbi:uncharacterized protein LOC108141587 [Drosophila elegans]|uniref:uncharacterized protein LOC108141587 n=1 Tax=Drosophila elegans TaxID=30023 RepID=UPI0007E7F762|nr:uncharacterized protein LOC108141587 [Drosophila elegans]
MTFWFLVCVLVTLNSTWPMAAEVASASTSQTFQFLERPIADQGWTHLLPTNFYSEMNQQYYRRFRRRAGLMLINGLGAGKRRPYPFEYARYV